MNVTIKTTVPAAPDEVVDYLLSSAFLDDFEAASGDLVHEISEVARRDDEGGKTFREVRFRAPTRLPWILRRYRDRAPDEVEWDEKGHWDRVNRSFTYHIDPEMPESWDRWYACRGEIRVEPHGDGSRVVDSLDFELALPGLGRPLAKALKSEISSLFEARKKAIEAHFS